MVDAAAVIGLDVAVGIEVDERQRAVLFGVCAEQRIGDVVVAAERDHLRTRRDDLRRMVLEALGEVFLAAPVEEAVTIVDDGERIEGIEVPWPERAPGILGGSLADALGTHARAGPVRDRLVEGNAGDRDVDALEVTRILAAHEGKRTRIGRLPLRALQAVAPKGAVARKRAIGIHLE